MAEFPDEGRQSYKTWLGTGEIEDVPASTKRRAAKRKACMQTNEQHAAGDNQSTVEVTDEHSVNNEKPKHEAVAEKQEASTFADNQIEFFSPIDEHCPISLDSEMNNDITCYGNTGNNEVILTTDHSTQCNIDENDDVDNTADDGINNSTDSGSSNENDIERNLCHPRDFIDFISNEDFIKIVSTPVDKKPAEIFLMVLKFSLACKLPFHQISNLLRLVNSIFGVPILPETKYMLDKLLNPKNNVQYHGICPNCGKCIGKLNKCTPFVACNICSLRVDLSKPSLENVFITIDPSEEIQNLVNQNDTYYDCVVNERKRDEYIKDIFDGKCYRNFVKKLPQDQQSSYLTSILNTDGAPRFECSSYSIWPVYLLINELPINVRLNNAVVCAMWFGKDKPPMHAFLEPLVSALNEMSNKGIECKVKKHSRLLRLYIVMVCVDSVAHAPMQGVKQFNGKYGCNWCLHKGEWFEGSQRYPVLVNYPEERTIDNMITFMKIITSDESGLTDVYGVKFVSPLINLNNFDIVKGMVPDYMHCCLLGVAKQITEYFLSSISNDSINFLDKLLSGIKVPRQLSRLTKPITDRGNWKAKEWENFILHYSIPLFRTVLQPNLIKYWALFVESMFTLLKHEISIAELDNADKKLHEFYVLTEQLLFKKAMTYNIHQLLHISASVMNWGPLWSHSTFPFESANHDLLQAIHSAKGVNLQIVRYVNFQRYCNFLENYIEPYISPRVTSFCKELSEKKIQKSCKTSHVTYLGSTTILNDETLTKFSLPLNSTVAYTRAVIQQCLYTSKHSNNKRSDSSFCQLKNSKFIRIIYFTVDSESQREITLCHKVSIKQKICDNVFLVENINNDVMVINTHEINAVCVFVEISSNSYITVLPNLYNQ